MFKSIVTGGCGFIGSHVVDLLVSLGHEVLVIDNLSAQSDNTNNSAKYLFVDICNKTLPIKGFDFVFHLAAQSRIPPSLEDPTETWKTNVEGTLNLLEVSRKAGIKKFVYSSTSACYGLKNTIPMREDMPNDCLNPYAVSKIMAEDAVIAYNKIFGLKTVSLRYFNVFGERQPTNSSYCPVVGIFLEQSHKFKNLTIVGDGEQRRDFVYVKDVAAANISACLGEECAGEILNIGSGSNVSINEIAQLISQNVEYLPPRRGEARNTLADINKAKRLIGFKPSVDVKQWVQSQI